MKKSIPQVKALLELIDVLKRLPDFQMQHLANIEREFAEREIDGDAMSDERAEDIFTETINVFDSMVDSYAHIRKQAREIADTTFKYWSIS